MEEKIDIGFVDGALTIVNKMSQDVEPILSEIEFHRMMGGYTPDREIKFLGIVPLVEYRKAVAEGIPIDKSGKAMREYLRRRPKMCINPETGATGKIVVK